MIHFKQDLKQTVEPQIIYLFSILYTIQQYKTLYVCFIDFIKAFDYINRNALIYKTV